MGTVDAATKNLKQRYISSRFSSVDEWPPYQPKHYTTLAFIHNKDKFTDAVRFSVAQELAVAGKIHVAQPCKLSDLNKCITKNISDIFLPVKAPDGSLMALRVLIEGAPGIGKTILAKEIAYQWATNELLTSKNLLLLVFLREYSQTQLRSIKELVKHVFINDEMVPQLINYLFKTEGEDAVIIIDGFDELSEENRKESIIIDIINRRILTKSCLVITSRPTASSILHGNVDRRVEIVGFTEEDRLNYIQIALEGKNEQIKALQHYLKSNPTINALCYIPLNMTILLCLAEDGIDTLPKTQTEMYKKFIKMTILRFFKRYKKHTTVISITKLPHPHNKLFIELAKLAYEALNSDKIVFTLLEIKEACPHLTMTTSNWSGLGLLKAVQYFSVMIGDDQVTFHFLHFSIQEYMAAWYISTLSDNKQIKLLKKTFWSHRYYNTWIMYVGITSGSSFALRHFLSGNQFQFYSKMFKSFKVSNKYLQDKIKCLHLFQCLVEANKEDIIQSEKQFFQNNQIDLSNQTLLPSDLNTLGFFLIRSIKKEWDELDLSNCNIGSEGCNILCDRFLDKDVRSMVTIKMVNFTYNQFNLSSLKRLFGLFKAWNTSEVIIADADAILDKATDIKEIEDNILQSHTLSLVFMGSYLFVKNLQLRDKVLQYLSKAKHIKSIYLLNCSWNSSDPEILKLLKSLKKQKLDKVRIIGQHLDKDFTETMALTLLHNSESDYVNMLVYDPTMSDEIADDISSSLMSSSSKGVMLIVSSSKVQGIVNTSTLSNELSALELCNLNAYVRYVYVRYMNTKMCPCSWIDKLEYTYNEESNINTFVEMLYIINSDWKLRIATMENHVLIVHKEKFESVNKSCFTSNNISIVYLSSCDVKEFESNITCSTLYVLNCINYVEFCGQLLENEIVPTELFIFDSIKDNLTSRLFELSSSLIYHHKISTVLAANDVIVGIHPNNQQIALAFRLQPTSNTWLHFNDVNANVFYQITDALVTLDIKWMELDITGCNIGDMECEIMYRRLRLTHSSIVRKLNISLNKLSVSGIHDLAKIILILEVQELNINETNDVLYDYTIINLIRLSEDEKKNVFLTITYSNKSLLIIGKTNLNKTTSNKIMNRQVSKLYIINCIQLSSPKEVPYLNRTHNLQRLCVVSGIVSETIVIEIIKVFSIKFVEVSISGVSISDDDKMIWKFITSREFFLDLIKFNFLLSTQHWLCAYNVTNYQSRFIHQYFMNQISYNSNSMALVKSVTQIDGDKMYVFQNDLVKLVRFRAEMVEVTGATQIINTLSDTTSLDTIEIDNYNITKTADNLANILHHNTKLQRLYLNGINLETNYAVKIAKALTKITTLTKLSISSNNITHEAADDIAAAISCNVHLQELNLGRNNLQASGAIKIAGGLQKISSLTKLYINHNNITHKAAEYIAAAISSKTEIKEFDVSGNNFQTTGVIKIVKGLKSISTLRRLVLYFYNNDISDEVADNIAALISRNTQIEVLDISGNGFQAMSTTKIAKNLQHICTPKTLLISDNNSIGADKVAAFVSDDSCVQELCIFITDLQATSAKITETLRGICTLIRYGNNDTSDEAASDIGVIVSSNANLKEIEISGGKLQTTGAIKIMKALQGIYTLKKLYLDNCITDEAADDIATVISCNIDLQELNLGNNNLQTSSSIKIAKSLQKISSLTKLYINHNNITHEAADDIAAAISCNIHLQELNLDNNNLQTAGIVRIARSLNRVSSLTKLCFNHNKITDEGAEDIAAAISCNIHLQVLNIASNCFTVMGATKIIKGLQKISTLTKLCFRKTVLTHNAADNIANAISCNTNLQELNLGSTGLQALDTIKIARGLQKILSLTKLYIDHNDISNEAADDIAAAISCNIHLQELNLGSNNLQTLGIIKIAGGLQQISSLTKLCIHNNNITREAADDIAAAISCNIRLQELNLGNNYLQTSGTIKITKALQKISTLTKLYIDCNNITSKAADDIGFALHCNGDLQEVNISKNALSEETAMKISSFASHLTIGVNFIIS